MRVGEPKRGIRMRLLEDVSKKREVILQIIVIMNSDSCEQGLPAF